MRDRIGKREIVRPLGSSEAEALRRYPAVHAFAEKSQREAASPRKQSLQPTPRDLHEQAKRYVVALGLDAKGRAKESLTTRRALRVRS